MFEHVYFARPDSLVYGLSVMATRREMGRLLARRRPVEADLVVPVPDSGVSAALGYAEASGIPFEFGLIRNHYVGRTFIEPRQAIRSFGVKVKLNPVRELLRGKRVVLVDDSLVRGTTSRKIVQMVRAAGAAEVHMRISSPPTTHSCFYGIDTPSREHLLASSRDVEQIREFIGADSVGYLTLEDLQAAMGDQDGQGFCYACFTGDYPVPPPGRAADDRARSGRRDRGQSSFEDGLRLLAAALAIRAGRRTAARRRSPLGLRGDPLLPEDPGGGGRGLPDPDGNLARLKAQCEALLTLRQDPGDALAMCWKPPGWPGTPPPGCWP